MIDSSTLVTASENQVSSVLGEEEVILNLENGMYYGLNPVGARVWQLIQEPRSVDDICNVLLDEFDVERQQLYQDVVALLQELKQEQLIQIEEPSPSTGTAD